jgi:hypothetical protein
MHVKDGRVDVRRLACDDPALVANADHVTGHER